MEGDKPKRGTGARTHKSRVKMMLLGVPLVVACGVVPWLIPWSGSTETSVARPPAVFTPGPNTPGSTPQTTTEGADPVPTGGEPGSSPEQQSPTDSDVTGVTDAVQNVGVAGYDLPVDTAAVTGVQTEPGPYRELGRLQIPSIGLDVAYGEGVFAETLVHGPGHWPGTPMPGRSGNSVISGHRNTETQPFKQLDELKPGDEITITGSDQSTTFRVRDTQIIPEAEYAEHVLRQPEDPGSRQVTLFACHPEGNPVFRIVVNAEA